MTQPPATAASATRQQQRIDDLCAASIRALSGDASLHFRGRRLYRGDKALPPFAPHLNPAPATDDFGSFRGAADAMALRVRLSDAELHKRLRPTEPLPRMLFEMMEQFRVEALAPADMPGMVHNLRHRFEAWSLAFFNSGLAETSRGILLYTVAQITRSRVTAQPVVEASEDAIEATRMSIVPTLGGALAGLRRTRHDQAAYAKHALSIVQAIDAMLMAGDEGDEADDAANEAEADEKPELFNLWMDFEAEGDDGFVAASSGQSRLLAESGEAYHLFTDEFANEAEADEKPELFNLWMDFEAEGDDGFVAASSGQSRLLAESGEAYHVFTDEFDTEVEAASLVRAAQLDEYRERMDQRIAQQAIQQARLTRELQAVLAMPERDGWQGGQEEGYIDGRQLSRLITSPSERRLFQQEQLTPKSNAAVGFLIDCSGSMRQHIEAVATLVDVMVRAFDQIDVTSEVLGFTTGAWNGGRAQKAWLRAGRPAHPGRLNETCHLVFKDSDTSWRRARRSMAALLKGDLFREGVDGEAVLWAARRLVERCDGRRLLLVFSDGSPTDGATALANDAHYLDHHLSHVVAQLSAQGEVEVYGVGVGLDLSPYYRQNRAFDLSNSVSNQVLREIVAMLAAGPRMRR